MKTPEISICIPVYNAEKYLSQCLDSVVEQTLKEVEIICVDDGSSDNSGAILDGYSKRFGNLRVIHQPNRGVMNARIVALRKAKGKFIAWVDNDDILEPNMYAKMLEVAKTENSDIVICNYRLFPKPIGRKAVWYKPYRGSVNHGFIARNTTLWNKIVSRKLLNKINAEKLFEDLGEESYHVILIEAGKISTIDEPLYNYRIGHTSASNNTNNLSWYKQVAVYSKNGYRYAKKHNYDKHIEESFLFFMVYYNMILAIVAAKNNQREIYCNAAKVTGYIKKLPRSYFLEFVKPIEFFVIRYFVLHSFYLARLISRITLR